MTEASDLPPHGTPASDTPDVQPSTSPRAATSLMAATYIIGAVGFLQGFAVVGNNPDGAIRWVAGLSVGVVGVVSLVRHGLFNRSDAARMGWDLGVRNNFQIETGIANGAIGAVALAGLALGWPAATLATVTLVYAAYFIGVTVLKAVVRDNPRWVVNTLAAAAQAALLGYFAISAGFTT